MCPASSSEQLEASPHWCRDKESSKGHSAPGDISEQGAQEPQSTFLKTFHLQRMTTLRQKHSANCSALPMLMHTRSPAELQSRACEVTAETQPVRNPRKEGIKGGRP